MSQGIRVTLVAVAFSAVISVSCAQQAAAPPTSMATAPLAPATRTPAPATSAPTSQPTASTSSGSEVGLPMVWDPGKSIPDIQGCFPLPGGDPQCITGVMQKAGASPQAVEFDTKALGGEAFLTKFQEMGKVDLGTIVYPTRANSNTQFILVNGTPPLIHVDDADAFQKAIDIHTDPLYSSLAAKFPQLEVSIGDNQFEKMEQPSAGGQRFIFSFRIVNGCRACEDAGVAHVAFDFDGSGSFTGLKLISLTEK